MRIDVISGRAEEPASGSVRYPARVFDSEQVPANRELVDTLSSSTLGMDLAAPPVVLPDFHHKSAMEMPSSIAVATAGTIRPTLTSSSVNCGMALIGLGCDRPTDAAITDFYRRVRERYPYPTTTRRDLSYDDVVAAATQGASFAVERYGVDASELERVEEFGGLDLRQWGGAERLKAEMPALTWQLARMRFGTVGPTNHFVELQQVEEILDPEAAELLGVREGQVTLQYHAGGGVLTGEIGHLFARRTRHRTGHAGCNGDPEAALPPVHGPVDGAGARADAPVLHLGVPAGESGLRRGAAADARQRRRDELRLRVPHGHLRGARGRSPRRPSAGPRVDWSSTRRTTRSTRRTSPVRGPSSIDTTRAAPTPPR